MAVVTYAHNTHKTVLQSQGHNEKEEVHSYTTVRSQPLKKCWSAGLVTSGLKPSIFHQKRDKVIHELA